MPSRHERKNFVENGIYHVFSRGVDKREIFHAPNDYMYFTECMMMYLLPKNEHADYFNSLGYDLNKIAKLTAKASTLLNFADEVTLHAYCLMPNHFHLLIEQKSTTSMARFLKSLLTRYAMYYSRKYGRIGPLFQGRYKAINIKSAVYFGIVTRYIHQNPADLNNYKETPVLYPWSSARTHKKARS